MKQFLLSMLIALLTISALTDCSNNGLSSADVDKLINGPNFIKGTITGTMLDKTPYSFDYDYHTTINDVNSYSESWIDATTGDSILFIDQYFYFDRNGSAEYSDMYSPSGKFAKLTLSLKMKSLKIEPVNIGARVIRGVWQFITPSGNRFVYGKLYYCACDDPNAEGSLDVTDLRYDSNTQILSGKMNFHISANNHAAISSTNHNETTITGTFNIYVPKESFQITKNTGDQGNVYRTSH